MAKSEVRIVAIPRKRDLTYVKLLNFRLVLTGIMLGVVLLIMFREQAQEMQLARWINPPGHLQSTGLVRSYSWEASANHVSPAPESHDQPGQKSNRDMDNKVVASPVRRARFQSAATANM